MNLNDPEKAVPKQSNDPVPVPGLINKLVHPDDLDLLLERGRSLCKPGQTNDMTSYAQVFRLYDAAHQSLEANSPPPSPGYVYPILITWNAGTTWHEASLQIGFYVGPGSKRTPFTALELESLPKTQDYHFTDNLELFGASWTVRQNGVPTKMPYG